MGGYGGEILRNVGEKMAGFGEFCKDVGYKITHDPLWGGITLGIVALILVLVVVKRRAS